MNRTSTSAQPETIRMPSRVLTEAGLADNNDISLRLEGEPASVQSLDANFPLPRALTREERDSFTDSSGRINFDDIREWQGLEPFRVPPPLDPIIFTTARTMTREERNYFTNSSGALDFDAVILFRRNNPDAFPPQDDILPPRQPETTSHEAYQSKGLTISKYLKTMSADEIRAHDIDGDRKICAVCLDDVCGQKDKVAILDECGHEFHYCCLKKWLRRKNICPLCRRTAVYNLQDR
ncbi:hypothetical protein CASFOL_005007 [Castilleja foliolosa]|uniref:RING-type domain-containing protein n=1 Tax=Castilleja foliolosa TaxID=1961234 RepID=A0ABD3E6A2_9LAMI